jgi:hypothetical protein
VLQFAEIQGLICFKAVLVLITNLNWTHSGSIQKINLNFLNTFFLCNSIKARTGNTAVVLIK